MGPVIPFLVLVLASALALPPPLHGSSGPQPGGGTTFLSKEPACLSIKQCWSSSCSRGHLGYRGDWRNHRSLLHCPPRQPMILLSRGVANCLCKIIMLRGCTLILQRLGVITEHGKVTISKLRQTWTRPIRPAIHCPEDVIHRIDGRLPPEEIRGHNHNESGRHHIRSDPQEEFRMGSTWAHCIVQLLNPMYCDERAFRRVFSSTNTFAE